LTAIPIRIAVRRGGGYSTAWCMYCTVHCTHYAILYYTTLHYIHDNNMTNNKTNNKTNKKNNKNNKSSECAMPVVVVAQ